MGEQKYISTLPLTPELFVSVGGQGHAPAALSPPHPPGKRPGTHCIGGWVGAPKGPVWTGVENLAYLRDSIPGPSKPVAQSYRLSYTGLQLYIKIMFNLILNACGLTLSRLNILRMQFVPHREHSSSLFQIPIG
jgi:hypothetical protein